MSLDDTSIPIPAPTEIKITPPAPEASVVTKTDFAFLCVAISFTLGSIADIFTQLAVYHRFVASDWEITIWMSILGLKTVTSMIASTRK